MRVMGVTNARTMYVARWRVDTRLRTERRPSCARRAGASFSNDYK